MEIPLSQELEAAGKAVPKYEKLVMENLSIACRLYYASQKKRRSTDNRVGRILEESLEEAEKLKARGISRKEGFKQLRKVQAEIAKWEKPTKD